MSDNEADQASLSQMIAHNNGLLIEIAGDIGAIKQEIVNIHGHIGTLNDEFGKIQDRVTAIESTLNVEATRVKTLKSIGYAGFGILGTVGSIYILLHDFLHILL